MNLLLAYSASHRARPLGQSEPKYRIPLLFRDVFPRPRKSLENESITTPNLATWIVLASLEINFRSPYGNFTLWWMHLKYVRGMVMPPAAEGFFGRTKNILLV
jgi:hypothetical protein